MAHPHIGMNWEQDKHTCCIIHILLRVSQGCVYASELIEALQKGLTQIKMAPYSFAVPTRPCYDCLCAPVWQSLMDVNQCWCFVQGSERVLGVQWAYQASIPLSVSSAQLMLTAIQFSSFRVLIATQNPHTNTHTDLEDMVYSPITQPASLTERGSKSLHPFLHSLTPLYLAIGYLTDLTALFPWKAVKII